MKAHSRNDGLRAQEPSQPRPQTAKTALARWIRMRSTSKSRRPATVSWQSHPFVVSAIGLASCAAWALYSGLRFPPEKAALNYVYHVPIVFPLVTFVLERSRSKSRTHSLSLALDAVVVVLAMWRIIGNVPILSGHALFLSYAALTCRTRLTRFAALLVLAETFVLKVFVWHDSASFVAGITLGLVVVLARRWSLSVGSGNPGETRQPS